MVIFLAYDHSPKTTMIISVKVTGFIIFLIYFMLIVFCMPVYLFTMCLPSVPQRSKQSTV